MIKMDYRNDKDGLMDDNSFLSPYWTEVLAGRRLEVTDGLSAAAAEAAGGGQVAALRRVVEATKEHKAAKEKEKAEQVGKV